MVTLISLNGVEVQVPESEKERLLGLGYAEKKAEKPKAAPRKRAAKPKE